MPAAAAAACPSRRTPSSWPATCRRGRLAGEERAYSEHVLWALRWTIHALGHSFDAELKREGDEGAEDAGGGSQPPWHHLSLPAKGSQR